MKKCMVCGKIIAYNDYVKITPKGCYCWNCRNKISVREKYGGKEK